MTTRIEAGTARVVVVLHRPRVRVLTAAAVGVAEPDWWNAKNIRVRDSNASIMLQSAGDTRWKPTRLRSYGGGCVLEFGYDPTGSGQFTEWVTGLTIDSSTQLLRGRGTVDVPGLYVRREPDTTRYIVRVTDQDGGVAFYPEEKGAGPDTVLARGAVAGELTVNGQPVALAAEVAALREEVAALRATLGGGGG